MRSKLSQRNLQLNHKLTVFSCFTKLTDVSCTHAASKIQKDCQHSIIRILYTNSASRKEKFHQKNSLRDRQIHLVDIPSQVETSPTSNYGNTAIIKNTSCGLPCIFKKLSNRILCIVKFKILNWKNINIPKKKIRNSKVKIIQQDPLFQYSFQILQRKNMNITYPLMHCKTQRKQTFRWGQYVNEMMWHHLHPKESKTLDNHKHYHLPINVLRNHKINSNGYNPTSIG